jgi:aminomethyltransferase
VAVQGPNARQGVRGLPSTQPADALKPFNAVVVQDAEMGELMVARTGYTGEDGFELVVPAENVAASGKSCPPPACARPAWARATRCAWKPA